MYVTGTHTHTQTHGTVFSSIQSSWVRFVSVRFGLVGHIKYAKYLVMCLSVCTFSILPDAQTDRQHTLLDSVRCGHVCLFLSLWHSAEAELDCSDSAEPGCRVGNKFIELTNSFMFILQKFASRFTHFATLYHLPVPMPPRPFPRPCSCCALNKANKQTNIAAKFSSQWFSLLVKLLVDFR